ncbi:MAG: phosphatase PAP2 family protein [Limnochordaceae bacterium]|nr:phosphatase PAP2 family protein [Limnochordaceae bacterium]
MFDAAVNVWLQHFSTPWLDAIMIAITNLGTAVFYMLLIPIIYWCVGRREGHNLMFLFLVSMWVNGLAKELFMMPRPAAAEGVRLVVHETSNGFPSGHAQGAITLWGYLATQHRRLWPWAIALILLISLSRLYLGAHYLGDVIGGLAIGGILLLLFLLGFALQWGARWPRWLKLMLSIAVPVVIMMPLYQQPTSLQTIGFLIGLLVTDVYALDELSYDAQAPFTHQVIKAFIGLAGFAFLAVLHARFIPEGLLSLVGYVFIAAWVTIGAPWLFLQLGLARPVMGGYLSGYYGSRTALRRTVVGLLVVLLALVAGLWLAQGEKAAWPAGMQPVSTAEGQRSEVEIIAHRGDSGVYPENTLASLAGAIRAQATRIELDARLTRDGQLVLLHDATVDRTTNGHGPVREMTLAHLQALDAAYWFSTDGGKTFPLRGQGIRVPTLVEAVQRVLQQQPEAQFLIELKDDDRAAGQALVRTLNALGVPDIWKRVLIASFADAPLRVVRQAVPQALTSLSRREAIRFAVMQRLALGPFYTPPAPYVALPPREGWIPALTPSAVHFAHAKGMRVFVWTIDDPEQMRTYLDMGVDGIITDQPGTLAKLLGKV